jgi:hypothetical protein
MGPPDWLAQAMAGRFEISCHERTTLLYAPDTATVWEEYVNGLGPVAATYAALPEIAAPSFAPTLRHRPYETRLGLVIPRPALLVRGVRP